MVLRSAAAVGLGLVLLAGCGEPGSVRTLSTPTATSPTPTPTPTTARITPTVTPKRPAGPADGTNLKACADRRCSVSVKAGDTIRFNKRVELREFTVTSITPRQLTFHIVEAGAGGFSGYLGGSGTLDLADVHLDVTPSGPHHYILTIRPRT